MKQINNLMGELYDKNTTIETIDELLHDLAENKDILDRFNSRELELEKMIHSIREADKAKGIGEKIVLKEEEELRRFATRSIQAIKNISKGEILKEGINIDILRPGNQKRGAEPRFLLEIIGKKATRDICLGEGILQADCSEE